LNKAACEAAFVGPDKSALAVLDIVFPLTLVNAAIDVFELAATAFDVELKAAVVLAAILEAHHALPVLVAHVPPAVVSRAARPTHHAVPVLSIVVPLALEGGAIRVPHLALTLHLGIIEVSFIDVAIRVRHCAQAVDDVADEASLVPRAILPCVDSLSVLHIILPGAVVRGSIRAVRQCAFTVALIVHVQALVCGT